MPDKTIRIYSKKCAEYLELKGFHYVDKVRDIRFDNFENWIYEDTEDLHKAIKEYKLSKGE